MTAAVKQFVRDLVSVTHDGTSATLRVALKALGIVGMLIQALFLFLIVVGIGAFVWNEMTAPPETPEQEAARINRQAGIDQAKRQKDSERRQLCLVAKACDKYSEARLACATAGNFKTCVRIKMGEDSFYSEMCSGYDVGAPAVPRPPQTPDAVECFHLTFGR